MPKATYNQMKTEPDIGHEDRCGLNVCVSHEFKC